MCIANQCVALGVTTSCFSFFLKDWSAAFGMPPSHLILGLVLFGFCASTLAPLVGQVLERFSARKVVVIALIGLALLHMLVGFATAGWQIILLYALLPVPITFATGIPTNTLVTRWFVKHRGLAFSLAATGLVLPGIIFPPIVVWLLGIAGWRATWWTFGVIVLVVAGIAGLVLRDRPEDSPPSGPGRPELEPMPQRELPTTGQILTTRNFWLVLLVFAPVITASAGIQANFAPLIQSKGLTPERAAALLAIFNVAAALGKLSVGMVCDRIGNKLPLIAVALLATSGALMMGHVRSFEVIAIALVCLGISQSAWVMLSSCIVAEFGQIGFPRAYGLANTVTVVANFSPSALAWAYEQTGTYTLGATVLAFSCVPSVISALFYREHRRASRRVGLVSPS